MKVWSGLIAGFIFFGMGACTRSAPTLSEPMKQELEKYVASIACTPSPSFPFEASSGSPCWGCEKFVNAGLVQQEISESEGDATPKRVRYYLTQIGEEAYVPATAAEGAGGARFCFGEPRLDRVIGIFGPVVLGGQKNYGISFIARLDNPNVYLFDERAKSLSIKLPAPAAPGQPVFYPAQNVGAVVNPNNPQDFYLDASLSVGPVGTLK